MNAACLMRNKTFSRLRGIAVLAGALLATCETIQAANLTWVGATGNWQDSNNWLPPHVPLAADTVIINSGFVTNTDAAVFVNLILTNSGRVSGPLVVASGARLEFGGGQIDQWVRVESGGVLQALGTSHGKYLGSIAESVGNPMWENGVRQKANGDVSRG